MRAWVAAVVAAAMVPAPVQAMSVADFLAKAAILKGKGMGAMFAPELKQVKAEIESITTAYRADITRQRAAGGPMHSCPPPKGKARMDSKQVFADLQAIPPAERQRTSMKDAFYAMMKKRYPCR